MRSSLVILVILVSLSGCYTKRKCLMKFPPVETHDTVVYETVRDSLVYKDTTITVTLPGETIIDSVYIDTPVPITSLDTLEVISSFAVAKAWVRNSRLSIELVQSGNLEVRLDSALRECFTWNDKYTEILNREVIEVKYIPKIYRVSLWAWVGVIVATIVAFILHRLKLF